MKDVIKELVGWIVSILLIVAVILSDRYICRTENAGKRFIYGDNFVGRRSPYRR